MHFIRNVFYWATQGCPDALPKGVIAIDLGDTADLTDDVNDVALMLNELDCFADTSWQVGCEKDDVDLIVKVIPHETYGEMGVYLTSDQIIPTWQFQLIKQQPNLVVSEHSLADLELECCECD